MELSHPLSGVTRHLLGAEPGAVQTYVHAPQQSTRDRHIVVCEWRHASGKTLKGSGAAPTKLEAYLKAVVELGETALCVGASVPNRSGMAGGLIAANALHRAKAELVERDAFLFHYRGRVPFLSRELADSGAWLFEMSSPRAGDHCFIALDQACVEGTAECVLLGLGCHDDRRTAAEKALGELAGMTLDHAMRPGWCRAVYEGTSNASRLTDLHHAHSRDPRNKARIRALCATGSGTSNRRTPLSSDWRIEWLESPLKYFKYVRASHPELAVLEFGLPEPTESPAEPPLYHPIW